MLMVRGQRANVRVEVMAVSGGSKGPEEAPGHVCQRIARRFLLDLRPLSLTPVEMVGGELRKCNPWRATPAA